MYPYLKSLGISSKLFSFFCILLRFEKREARKYIFFFLSPTSNVRQILKLWVVRQWRRLLIQGYISYARCRKQVSCRKRVMREAASKWSGRCRAFVGSVVEVKVFVSTKATSAITPAIRQCLSISLLPRDSLVSVTHLLYLTDAVCVARCCSRFRGRENCVQVWQYLETKLVQTILIRVK